MKRIIIISTIGILLVGILLSIQCSNNAQGNDQVPLKDNTLTEEQIQEGWKLLFDGKTTEGWHSFRKGRVTPSWTVVDGNLTYTPSDIENSGGDLLTDEQFDNFHLKMDWKISPCGNSGIMFLVQEKGREKTYHTGPEMQVLDDTCHPDAKTPSHRAGSLYDMIVAKPGNVKPAGEWNKAEIILNPDKHLTFKLNDSVVVETVLFDEKWADMIAGSKFRQWPGFGVYSKGHIALQDHGDKVEFKNVMIKKL